MNIFSSVNVEHVARIERGLHEFFSSSPNEALRSGEVYRDGRRKIDIDLDVDEHDLACCELKLEVSADINEDYIIRIYLDRLRISRSQGCRRGNEYLEAIRYMLDHFFIRSNPIFSSMPIRRMYFEVETDIASIAGGMEPLNITNHMYEITTTISKRQTVNGLDFQEMTLSDLLHLHPEYRVGQESDFWSYVVRVRLPDAYQGDIRLSRLAGIVLENVTALEPIVYKLLCQFWFHQILPLIDPRPKVHEDPPDDEKEEEEEEDADEVRMEIAFEPIHLGMLTLLTRDDCKTWYMHHLDLSVCNQRGPMDSKKLDSMVRRYQEKPFCELLPKPFKSFFQHITSPTKQVLLDCVTNMRKRRRLTFFEYMQLYLIDPKHNGRFGSKFDDYFANVCRELW